MMRSPANQRRRTRNRSNRRTPATPTNQRETIQYTPKNKYSHSEQNANGVLILSKRKRRLALDPAEVERKKQKALDVKKKTSYSYSFTAQSNCIMAIRNEHAGFTIRSPQQRQNYRLFAVGVSREIRSQGSRQQFLFSSIKAP